MKIGRNAPCPCGSGKKYKFCHQKKEAARNNDWSKIGLAVTAAVIILAVVVAFTTILGSDANTEGMVWSAEHGHWHNADGTEVRAGTNTAPPPGLPPPGKVWSAEHGHWHDIE